MKNMQNRSGKNLNAHGLFILMKKKYLSTPEPGMEKIEADLLHLKCKTENPVKKIIT